MTNGDLFSERFVSFAGVKRRHGKTEIHELQEHLSRDKCRVELYGLEHGLQDLNHFRRSAEHLKYQSGSLGMNAADHFQLLTDNSP